MVAHASRPATPRSSTTACRWRRTDWIRDGVLAALVADPAHAALTGLPVTPGDRQPDPGRPGGRGGVAGRDVAGTERGLLLTCLWYIREVDPQTLLLTGLTRDGVYLVEDGEVTGAVNNFRFNESPVDLLGRLAEVGAPSRRLPREWGDYFTRTAMPPAAGRRTSTCPRSARPAKRRHAFRWGLGRE